MQTTIEDGVLVIRVPLAAELRPSSTGKTLIAATTGGFIQTPVQHKGQFLKVSVTATVPAAK